MNKSLDLLEKRVTEDLDAPPRYEPQFVEERLENGVLSWMIYNPGRANALSPPMLQWLAARAASLDGDIVLLRSYGTRCFCSGFDLSYLEEESKGDHSTNPQSLGAKAGLGENQGASQYSSPDAALITASHALLAAHACFVADCRAPVYGAGVELLSLCDFVFCSSKASFAVPAGKLGVVYHRGGIEQFEHRFSPELVRRLLLLGEVLPATDPAMQNHLYVYEDEESLERERDRLIENLRAQSPHSRSAHARWLRQPRSFLTEQVQLEHQRSRQLAYESPEHRQALAARRSKTQKPPST